MFARNSAVVPQVGIAAFFVPMDVNKCKNLPLWTVGVWLAILLCFLLMGCRTKNVTEYVAVHDTLLMHKTDTMTLYKVKETHDTLRQEVERVVTLRESGDTLRVAVYRDRWRTIYRTDTTDTYRAKYDSLKAVVDRSRDKTTVKERPWWERWGWKTGVAVVVGTLLLFSWRRMEG